MAVDIPNIFNEQLPGILQRNADEAKAINAKFQMNITGAGSWHLDLTSSGPTVAPGEKPADCTVTIAADDFVKLQENPSAGHAALFCRQAQDQRQPDAGDEAPEALLLEVTRGSASEVEVAASAASGVSVEASTGVHGAGGAPRLDVRMGARGAIGRCAALGRGSSSCAAKSMAAKRCVCSRSKRSG